LIYKNITTGGFIDRPNRFIAHVEIDGLTDTVHVKNTGRCKELLIPGAEVVLSKSDNPKRKTKYDLIAVYKEKLGLINIDSQAPNHVAQEWLEELPFDLVKPEYTYDKSRIDFYMEKGKRRFLLEVKGCTLERDGIGYFPDAPTERGVKHLHELKKAAEEGITAAVAFAIPMLGVRKVLPNDQTQPEFGAALREAEEAGVKVLYLPCIVKPDEVAVDRKKASYLNSGFLSKVISEK
jgi:sugar fermentation stimulation protein A